MSNSEESELPKQMADLRIEQSDIENIFRALQSKPNDLFLLDVARYVVGRRRYESVMQRNGLAVTDDEKELWGDAIDLAKKGLSDFGAVGRTSRLLRPMVAIDKVFFGAPEMKALSIGPRTEMELLSLIGQGFKPENVRGLDLISYSPWIDVGNAHDMPYEDNSFDVVVAGWVLVYSSDPAQICKEILRVARCGAVIAIGSTYWPEEKRLKEAPGRTAVHYPLVEDVLAMFDGYVDQVYVRHNPADLSVEGRTIVLFDIDK